MTKPLEQAEPDSPIRRCVVCRKAGAKRSMIRFCLAGAADGGKSARRLRLDPLFEAEGRGAYCHQTAVCAGSKGLVELLVRSLLSAERGGNAERPTVEAPRPVLQLLDEALSDCRADGADGGRLEELGRLSEDLKRKAAGGAAGKGSIPKLRL